jgi:hypothetical protein
VERSVALRSTPGYYLSPFQGNGIELSAPTEIFHLPLFIVHLSLVIGKAAFLQ